MQIRIRELKTELRRRGLRLTWADIESGTGIRNTTLFAMDNGTAKTIRPEYLDALCQYFDVGIEELLKPESVDLPLDLNIRPDRKGRRSTVDGR